MSDRELYRTMRIERLRLIVETLQRHNLLNALRGSWKHNDFHLDCSGRFSLSDLDLVVDGKSVLERKQLQITLQEELKDSFPLRVSIHGEDSLLKMNLVDSFVLSTGEFISKTRNRQDPNYDYALAKIALLFLRSFLDERLFAVATRIGTPEARLALDVKLGLRSTFPTESAAALLYSDASPITIEFVEECVLAPPSARFVEIIRSRVRSCPTIDPWLQEYLISKMDATAE
ncbi:MAG: hypothetical protein HY322_05095 [Betaproteobacteria bacterium]|nr:hypothetical protein [Betaproteobacteria bacterium]